MWKKIETKLVALKNSAIDLVAGRMSVWFWISVLLTLGIVMIAPRLLGTTMVKMLVVTGGGWLGFWGDRRMFPYARPDAYLKTQDWLKRRDEIGKVEGEADFPIADGYHMLFAVATIRRALMAVGGMVAAALAV